MLRQPVESRSATYLVRRCAIALWHAAGQIYERDFYLSETSDLGSPLASSTAPFVPMAHESRL